MIYLRYLLSIMLLGLSFTTSFSQYSAYDGLARGAVAGILGPVERTSAGVAHIAKYGSEVLKKAQGADFLARFYHQPWVTQVFYNTGAAVGSEAVKYFLIDKLLASYALKRDHVSLNAAHTLRFLSLVARVNSLCNGLAALVRLAGVDALEDLLKRLNF